jgi:ATP-dependent helicase Lhr and Lhr-like helicase
MRHRIEVEELSAALHGEASRPTCRAARSPRDERRQAQEAFAVGSDCVIVATSTLELGLEVGDHDRVFQIDAPVTVASFLQRMGRSGRRAGSNANMLFLATRPEYLLRALALDLLGSRGYVEPVVPLAVDPAGGEHDLEGLGRRDKEKEIRNNARPGSVCTGT